MRVLSAVALPVIAAGVVGCAGGHKASGVFAVKKGMTQAQVIATAGKPYLRGGPTGRGCWLYHASKKGTSIDGMRFCFTKGRVSLVQIATHL